MNERISLLIGGASGTGKSLWIASLKNALIFDTEQGLAYADERIAKNGSERVEVATYRDVEDEIRNRKGKLDMTWVAIDHLTTLHHEAVLRYNPTFQENTFGKEFDKANKEWRRLRGIIRYGDFNLACSAHMKALYENKQQTGMTSDASKNIAADFNIVLFLERRPDKKYPSLAIVEKFRRDPEDKRGLVPPSFPFTLDDFFEINGTDASGERHEIPMATPEQIAELNRLLELVKLPEGTVDKWMAKAKAESWAEMTEEVLEKCIAYVKNLLDGGKKG